MRIKKLKVRNYSDIKELDVVFSKQDNIISIRKLFDELYDTWLEMKWKERREMLIDALKLYFDNDYKKTVAFVEAEDRQQAMYTFMQQYQGQYFTVESCTKLF